jgi:hypothetical protein
MAFRDAAGHAHPSSTPAIGLSRCSPFYAGLRVQLDLWIDEERPGWKGADTNPALLLTAHDHHTAKPKTTVTHSYLGPRVSYRSAGPIPVVT